MSGSARWRLIAIIGMGALLAAANPGPTLAQIYPSSSVSLSGPAKLARNIAEALNREIAIMLKKPETIAKFDQLGLITESMSLDEFTSFVAAESAHWRPMIEAAGLLGKVQ